jgi:hypothetical protein
MIAVIMNARDKSQPLSYDDVCVLIHQYLGRVLSAWLTWSQVKPYRLTENLTSGWNYRFKTMGSMFVILVPGMRNGIRLTWL